MLLFYNLMHRIANALVTLGNNLNVSSGPVTVSAPGIAIHAQMVQPGDTPSFGISTGSDGNFGNNPIGDASDSAAVTIQVPAALTSTPNVSRITLGSYINDGLFQERGTDVASIIVSFDAADDEGNIVTISSLASPITFNFLFNGNIDLANCSFYDFESKLYMGMYIHYFLCFNIVNQWSQRGCSVVATEGNIVTCACDHLSVFGATMVSYTVCL